MMSEYPFVIVGYLPTTMREDVIQFLLELNAPVYAEAPSGVREDTRLEHLRINCVDRLYPFDSILRIGGVPTLRLWRDLEDMKDIKVYSISPLPFPGLSREVITVPLNVQKRYHGAEQWIDINRLIHKNLQQLFEELPTAEPSLFHTLSQKIPNNALVYLGNSLPIREWDLAATYEDRGYQIHANRGLNGIDGQVSTFLGLSTSDSENWSILGDLTTLYDMAGFWILPQLEKMAIRVVVVNNGGGKIFARKFSQKVFQNLHELSFKPLAEMWGLSYEKWENIPNSFSLDSLQLIELVPDPVATEKFWKK